MKFRFLNIPVFIHPTFWVFLLLFTNILFKPTIESIILGAVMFFSLLVHEYGHALTALYFGAKPSIILEAFGGRAEYNGSGITPKQQFIITLNGPLFESILIFLSYSLLQSGVFDHSPLIHYLLTVTMRLNILWCLLNLIPIVPLDGGMLLRYMLIRKFGAQGRRASILIGLLTSTLLAPYLLFKGLVFFGALLLIMAWQHYMMLQHDKQETNSFGQYLKGVDALKNNDLTRAKAILTRLLKSKDPKIKHLSTETMAKIYHQENQPEKSYELLLTVDPQYLKEGKPLLCHLAFLHQNYQLVTEYAHDNYTIAPTLETALLNSKAFAHLSDPDLSGAWLHTASQFGPEFLPQIKAHLTDPAYNTVRNTDLFKQYADKI